MSNTYKGSRLIGKAKEGLQAVAVNFNISLSVVCNNRAQRLLEDLLRNFASHVRRSLTTSVTVPRVTGVVLIPLDSLVFNAAVTAD